MFMHLRVFEETSMMPTNTYTTNTNVHLGKRWNSSGLYL